MPLRRLNFREIETRMNQIVIDLHDAARMTQDIGVAERLRGIAHAQNDLVREMRQLLPSDADSRFGEFQ